MYICLKQHHTMYMYIHARMAYLNFLMIIAERVRGEGYSTGHMHAWSNQSLRVSAHTWKEEQRNGKREGEWWGGRWREDMANLL